MSGNVEVGKWAVVYKPYPCCGHRPAAFGIPLSLQESALMNMGDAFAKKIVQERTVMDVAGDPLGFPLECVKRIPDPPPASEPATRTREIENA